MDKIYFCVLVINTCTFIYDIINLSFSLSILSFLLHTCIKIIEIFNYNLSLRDYNSIQALLVLFLGFFWAADNLFILKGITYLNFFMIHILYTILILWYCCWYLFKVYFSWLYIFIYFVCFKSWLVNNLRFSDPQP